MANRPAATKYSNINPKTGKKDKQGYEYAVGGKGYETKRERSTRLARGKEQRAAKKAKNKASDNAFARSNAKRKKAGLRAQSRTAFDRSRAKK